MRCHLCHARFALLSPGATSPIDWVRECVLSLAPDPSPQRNKILLGLNFYGYDFSTSDMEGILVVCISLYATIVGVCVSSQQVGLPMKPARYRTILVFAIMGVLTKGSGTGRGARGPQFLTFTRRRFAQIIGWFVASHASHPPNHISVPPPLVVTLDLS